MLDVVWGTIGDHELTCGNLWLGGCFNVLDLIEPKMGNLSSLGPNWSENRQLFFPRT